MRILRSIPLRISLLVCGGEAVFLVILGVLIARRYAGSDDALVFGYWLAAGVFLVFSGVLSAFAAHQLIVPRLERFKRAIDHVIDGDLSIRLDEKQCRDELDSSFARVNGLVCTIEDSIGKLVELNQAQEALSGALNKDEVMRVVAEVIEKQFVVRCVDILSHEAFFEARGREDDYRELLAEGEVDGLLEGAMQIVGTGEGPGAHLRNEGRTMLFVPIIEESNVSDIMVFSGGEKRLDFDPVTMEFARSLSRMTAAAFGRIRALGEITRAESKYRALFMTAEGGIYRSDAGGRLEDVNPALAAMGGYDSVEEMLLSVTHTSQAYADLADKAWVREELKTKDRIKDAELYLRRKDGSTFPVSLSAHTVRNKHGDLVAIEGFVLDLSERKRREEAERKRAAAEAASRVKSELLHELEEKNAQLRETLAEIKLMQKRLLRTEKAAAIGAMAEGIAHELSNFLAGAVTYPDLLLNQMVQEDELRKPLEEMKRAGEQAVALTNDLLALSDVSGGKREVRDFNGIVEGVLQSLVLGQIQMARPELQIEATLGKDQASISCHPFHIGQAITNLLKTSATAAGESGRVEVVTSRRDLSRQEAIVLGLQAGPHAVLTVSDSGPGLNQEQREHIFEPFYSRKVYGMGFQDSSLGLAMTENIVQDHEGNITVDSTVGRTTFTVYLPISVRPEATEREESGSTADYRGEEIVLVVDDEPLQREVTGKMLTELGYRAHAVSSGRAALEFLEKQPVDLVLLDMLMPPGMNGRETYERIVELNPQQKALIVTGYASSSEVKRTLELGAAGILKKPFTFSEFGLAVKSALQSE